MASFVTQLYRAPSISVVDSQSIEELLLHPEAMFKVGVQIAKGTPFIRVGDLLGMVQSGSQSGKFRRYTAGIVKNAQLTGDSSIVLKDASGNVTVPPFAPGETITIAGASGPKVIAAVYPNTGTITIVGTLGGAVSVGAAVALTTLDGSETAACIAARPVYPDNFVPDLTNTAAIPLLNYDGLIDAIWSGIVRKSVVKGLDAAAMTALSAVSFTPFMDAVKIR